MRRHIMRFCGGDRGATSIEYALIAGFLSIAIVGAANELGSEVREFFVAVKNAF